MIRQIHAECKTEAERIAIYVAYGRYMVSKGLLMTGNAVETAVNQLNSVVIIDWDKCALVLNEIYRARNNFMTFKQGTTSSPIIDFGLTADFVSYLADAEENKELYNKAHYYFRTNGIKA